MRTQHDLSRELNDLKRDADDPLMSRESVIALLAANPIASVSPSNAAPVRLTRRASRMPWVVGGSLALAATVALVVVSTRDSTVETDALVQQPTTQVETRPASGDVAVATSNDASETNRNGNGAPLAEQSDGMGPISPAKQSAPPQSPPTSKQKSMPRLEIATIRLAATQLAPFGLAYSGGSITYIEDATRVTIRANGVATKMDAGMKDVSTVTPVMVVVYHDEAHFSSWWDKKNTDIKAVLNTRNSQIKMPAASAINGLIAIRVPLEAANVLASKVDVVLWFPGTREVAERLPEQYRKQLLSELGIAQTTTTTHYTQPDHSSSSLIQSSLVYPNPLRNGMASIRMQMKRPAVCTGVITDMFGKEIATAWQSQSVSEGQTDLPLFGLDNAPTGVYNVVVTFEGSQERIVQRLMIQR